MPLISDDQNGFPSQSRETACLLALLRLAAGSSECDVAAMATRGAKGPFQIRHSTGSVPAGLITKDLLEKLSGISGPTLLTAPNGWSLAALLCSQKTSPGGKVAPYPPAMMVLIARPGCRPLDKTCFPVLTDVASLISVSSELPRRKIPSLPDRSDSLTALKDRIRQTDRLPRRAVFGLINLKLDHLALMNERYGWDTADLVLAEITQRIQDILPEDGFLGHIGGGHFMVLTPPGFTAITTRTLVLRILRLSALPVELEMGALPISLSAGWSMYPQDGGNENALLLSAKAALAEADRTGGGHERRTSTELVRLHMLSSSLEQDLLKAIDRDELFLKWMPIVDTVSQKIIAYEALLRWNRPGHGEVSPTLFIQHAEKAGMIEAIDKWSLHHACLAALDWKSSLRVCVNVSPVWLVNERLSGIVEKVLRETGIAPHRLQIELSERRPFGPADIAFRELARVRAMGVKLALDDFGAGYSSLERLQIYPLDQIKLDRAFMAQLGESPRADAVMTSILNLARTLNLTCCAKGVETEFQMAFLDTYGCEEVQGYLFGAPVREQDIPLPVTDR
ncbi:putative bifunctional diguanylate cyclase/phosphodiesterase [Gluconobacter morbifer]|uniref:Sensory box/GGDEF family protein n=1 Tax=Gluconobacter morbifer G707 TaxID=1088869 RepID=G6XIA2_9PROT|nr:GGDEF domain-containing phosphodiesterase [Gluconobacter morbifer]EHH68542.1 sensory box/GGDEF family protein [Gluconobacter morbifer G707]